MRSEGRGQALRLAGLTAGAVVLALLSLRIGPAPLPLRAVVEALLGRADVVTTTIVTEIRLPRAILSVLVGAMLGGAGAALQGYLRNPLAEPSILGASNAASLGAVIAIYFGLAGAMPLALPLMAVTGSLIALGLLLALARQAEGGLGLILAGIALSTLCGAAISLALNLAPNPFAAIEIMSWLMGSLEDRSFAHVRIALPLTVVGLLLLMWDGRALDALTLDEEGAQSLGVNLRAARLRLLLAIGLGVGGGVAVAGAIGFVGLVVPHLVRPLTDRRPSSIVLPSMLGGAALLTAADILVRLVPTTNELRLGVVTAFLGVPFFLFFLMKERRLW